MLLQNMPIFFSDQNLKAIEQIMKVANDTRKLKAAGFFEEASVYIKQRPHKPQGVLGIRHLKLIVVTDDNQANVEIITQNDLSKSIGKITYSDENNADPLLIFNELVKRPDFHQVMMKNDNTGDIRHDDMSNLKDESARQEAEQTYYRLNEELSALFQPAFTQIVNVNANYPKTHSMTAQFAKTGLATMDMAGRLMMTMSLENKSQITFISGATLQNTYETYGINSYEGTEEEFKSMISEVVAASDSFTDVLKPESVVFAGTVIS